jgi:NADP-dependent 3-hydroxy acid dehydrogenase YdfG
MTRNKSEMAKRMNKIKALETDDIARVIEFILDQPPHCSISEVMIRPTEQEL